MIFRILKGQNQLSTYIEWMVLPIIHHYTLVTEMELKALGYEAPPEESAPDPPEGGLQQVVVE